MLRSLDLVCYNMRYNPGFLKRCHQIDCFSNVKPTFRVGLNPRQKAISLFLAADRQNSARAPSAFITTGCLEVNEKRAKTETSSL